MISRTSRRRPSTASRTIFVPGHYRMKVKKTSRVIDCDWVVIYTIRDGKVAGFREHTDTAQFVKAFG